MSFKQLLRILLLTFVITRAAQIMDDDESELSTMPHRALQTDPVWWNAYRAKYGKRAKKCKDQPTAPANGSTCKTKRAGEYSCFWGDQTCSDGTVHPQTKCDCLSNGIWKCADPYQACEAPADKAPFTTCPVEHPLNFPYKLTCKSDFLVCNYGHQTCCE